MTSRRPLGERLVNGGVISAVPTYYPAALERSERWTHVG